MKDDKKVSKNREKKEKIVAELSDKVTKAKALVFANYQGMTHKQVEEIKKAIRSLDAEIVVTKNTLLKKSLEDVLKTKDIFSDSDFRLPTATLFAYSDVVMPLKELAKVFKNIKLPTIKFGILSREAGSGSARERITAEDVIKLSSLPSREILIAQVVGGLKSPIFGLHKALNWNIQKFVRTLKAIETKKA